MCVVAVRFIVGLDPVVSSSTLSELFFLPGWFLDHTVMNIRREGTTTCPLCIVYVGCGVFLEVHIHMYTCNDEPFIVL